MKRLLQSIKITKLKELNGKTVVQAIIDAPPNEVLKYKTEKGLYGEVLLDDGKSINHEQRKKFYAMVADISNYTGYEPEYLKELFKFWYCAEIGIEYFSLSDCPLEVARELITFSLEFALLNDIPLSETAIERTDDIDKYLYYCLKSSKCIICGLPGMAYTIDNDKNKLSLCIQHHDIAKDKGLEEFCKLWKVYGIRGG